VTGAQGLDTVLDLAFLHGVVQLCATCVFTFENITLANERRGVCNSPTVQCILLCTVCFSCCKFRWRITQYCWHISWTHS
jgi:vacuolar-type H+-ATPase subunit I/STV1